MSSLPKLAWNYPTLNHDKKFPYIDFPVVYNDTVTNEAFYIEHDFTFVTSDATNTSLYKWNGGGWTQVSGISNPELVFGRGYYSVTTAANAYVAVTEHFNF